MAFEFKIIDNVRQMLDPKVVYNDCILHIVTVSRGQKRYMAYVDTRTSNLYIEQLDPTFPGLFKVIEDDMEFSDLYFFLKENRYLEIGREHTYANFYKKRLV